MNLWFETPQWGFGFSETPLHLESNIIRLIFIRERDLLTKLVYLII